MKNRWTGAALWGAAVVLAVGAGTGAVAAATAGSGRPVLSQGQVDRDVNGLSSPATSSSTGPRPAQPAPQANPSQPLTVSAGTVVVQCDGNTATLLRSTPKIGFRTDDPVFGPAAVVSVRFSSDASKKSDVAVSVRCTDGTAVSSTTIGDDHGGDSNGSGKGNGGPDPTATGDDNGGDNGGGNDNGGSHGGKGKGGHGGDDN